MGSRLRDNPQKIFECFVEVVPATEPDAVPWVLQKFPDTFSDEEVLKSVAHFCYPCDINSTVVQVFSFVLTGADSKWTFGYCRHTPKAPTAICLLSSLPWHETFYELLNRVADITQRQEACDLIQFLECLYDAEVPDPGGVLEFKPDQRFQCSDHTKLPSIPENRNVSEYFNAVDAQNMMVIFASMLNERRIVITSNKLSRLSACVQSANALIYPMHWQHIFIPILPTNLLDYLSAPMPFLIGVPSVLLEKAPKLDLNEIVILYADQNKVQTPFDDLQNLPPEVVSSLKRHLKNSTAMLGDRVARAFLYSLVQLIGGYRDALDFGEKITFNRDAFIQTRTPSMQPFLQRMLQLQIFQEFIEERLDMLNAGEGFSDEFEFQVNVYAEKSSAKLRNQYKEWMSSMKKEGGAFLKSVKNKVKDRSKKAYKGVRSKIQELQQKEAAGDGSLPSPVSSLKSRQPRSAPSSPTLLRSRPATFHGLKSGTTTTKSASSIKLTSTLNDSKVLLTPRQYNLLDVSAETTPEPAQEDTEELSRSSSPNLTLRRISMDLMGDLQDIIFRRCSVGDSTNGDISLKSAASSESVQRGSPSPVPTPTHGGDGLTPIPPPRTKRRGAASTKAASQGTATPELAAVCDESAPQDRLLIQLEPEEEPEEVFDPLLQPKSNTVTSTVPNSHTTNSVKEGYLPSASQPLPIGSSSFHHQSMPYSSSPIPFQSVMMPPSSVCVTMMGMSPASTSYMNAAPSNAGPRFSTFHPMTVLSAPSSLPTMQPSNLQPSPFSSATVPTNPFKTAAPASGLQSGFAIVQPAAPTHNFYVPTPTVVDSFGMQSLGAPVFQSTNPFADASVPVVGIDSNSHPIVPNVKSTVRPKVPPPPRPLASPHPNRNTVADPFSSGAAWDGRATVADSKPQLEWETFN